MVCALSRLAESMVISFPSPPMSGSPNGSIIGPPALSAIVVSELVVVSPLVVSDVAVVSNVVVALTVSPGVAFSPSVALTSASSGRVRWSV